MYIEKIKYQINEHDEWLTGYYVGKAYNSDKSILLDKDYKPIGVDLWDYKGDYENRICLSLEEREDWSSEDDK